jgi:Cu/Ag efflux protein CusF
MHKLTAAVVVSGMVILHAAGVSADATRLAQAPATGAKAAEDKPAGRAVVGGVRVRGTVDAVDKERGMVTLKGPKGRTLTLEVKDKAKLDAIKVGDPVVANYVEAVAVSLSKQGAPGVSTQEARVTSKPGETPAGGVGREVTVTATVTAIDKKANTVTIKGPAGNSETVKARDPKNLEKLKVGDMIDITYTQALAISLDKPAK